MLLCYTTMRPRNTWKRFFTEIDHITAAQRELCLYGVGPVKAFQDEKQATAQEQQRTRAAGQEQQTILLPA